eukprot:gene13876-biopygen6542
MERPALPASLSCDPGEGGIEVVLGGGDGQTGETNQPSEGVRLVAVQLDTVSAAAYPRTHWHAAQSVPCARAHAALQPPARPRVRRRSASCWPPCGRAGRACRTALPRVLAVLPHPSGCTRLGFGTGLTGRACMHGSETQLPAADKCLTDTKPAQQRAGSQAGRRERRAASVHRPRRDRRAMRERTPCSLAASCRRPPRGSNGSRAGGG